MRRIAMLAVLGSLVASLQVADAADSTKLTDVRVAMDDGVILAADVYIPTIADVDGDGLYPCVVEVTPYRKENRAAEGAGYLPSQGVALIEVDARGTGGSNGEYDIVFSTREQRDSAQWVDWAGERATKDGAPLAADRHNQLCESTVGMYGGSYSGIIQYLTASLPLVPGDVGYGRLPMGSPHLSAIAPARAYGDLYRDIVYHGGIVIGSFGSIWSGGTTAYYTEPPTDMPGAQAQSAWLDHLTRNDPLIVNYIDHPYIDETFTQGSFSQRLYEDSSTLPRIRNLRVPTLHLAGEFDAFTRGQIRTFREALEIERQMADRGPNLMILGPWNHTGTHFINPDEGFKQQLGDWYRYWLEGRVNDAPIPAWINTGPRVTYFQTTTGIANAQSAADGEWRTAEDWPPPTAHATKLHLAGEGGLVGPAETFLFGDGASGYLTTPTTGKAETWSRWDNAAGVPIPQQQLDQRLEDRQGATFTTGPLKDPLSIDGPMNLHMFASTYGLPIDEAPDPTSPGAAQFVPPYQDTDWIVKVSDVAPDGSAMLVTQGYLRASHGAVDPEKSEYLDGQLIAAYHPHTFASLQTTDGVKAYDIEIWPTAKTWAAGHALRIDVYSADLPGHLALLKPAINTIFFGPTHDSYLTLPVTD